MYFEKWYPVDLVRLPAHIQDVGMTLFVGDADSIRIGVNVTRDGAEETVTGAVKGIVILPDGSDILPFNGSSDGSRAWIDLPGTALVMSGRVQIALRVYDDGAVTTLLAVSATVRRADADRHFDPDDVVGDITELISEAERVSGVAETAAAQAQDALEQASNIVSYAAQSGQTDAEKAQARQNIGADWPSLGPLTDIGYGDGSRTQNNLQIVRAGMQYTFTGYVGTGSGGFYIKLNNTLSSIATASGAAAFTSPTKLVIGRKYRARITTLSGSVDYNDRSELRVYMVGTYDNIGSSSMIGDDWLCDFEYTAAIDNAGGVQIVLMFYRTSSKGAIFSENGWVVLVTLEDITSTIPEVPITEETVTYTLKCTVTNGVPTFSWVPENGGLLSTPLTLTPTSISTEESETGATPEEGEDR